MSKKSVSPQTLEKITQTITIVSKAPLNRATLLLQLQEDKDLKQVREQIEENEGKLGYFKDIPQIIILEIIQRFLESYFAGYAKQFVNILWPKKGYSPWRSFFKKTGMLTLTNMCTQLLVYPFKTIKEISLFDTKNKYNGWIDCLKTVTKERGLISLYNGFGLSVLSQTSERVISYSVFDKLYIYAPENNKNLKRIYYSALASFASTVGTSSTYALTTISKRDRVLNVDKVSYHNLTNGIYYAGMNSFLCEILDYLTDKLLKYLF